MSSREDKIKASIADLVNQMIGLKTLDESKRDAATFMISHAFNALLTSHDRCIECEEHIDKKFACRCPKHVAMLVIGGYAKDKLKTHGPGVAMGAVGWFNALFEKLTDETEPSPKGDFQEPA